MVKNRDKKNRSSDESNNTINNINRSSSINRYNNKSSSNQRESENSSVSADSHMSSSNGKSKNYRRNKDRILNKASSQRVKLNSSASSLLTTRDDKSCRNQTSKKTVTRCERSVFKTKVDNESESLSVTVVFPTSIDDRIERQVAAAAELSVVTSWDSLRKANRLKENRRKSKSNKLLNHIKSSVLRAGSSPSPLFCPAAPSNQYLLYTSSTNSPNHYSSSGCVCDNASVGSFGSGSDINDFCPNCGMMYNSQYGDKEATTEEDLSYICLSPI